MWDEEHMTWLDSEEVSDKFRLNKLETRFLVQIMDRIQKGWPSNVLCSLGRLVGSQRIKASED